MAQGYFDAFFRVEQRLGMGASGAVFLVQHVIDGNELGRFALKRIAVGSSSAYLLDVLRDLPSGYHRDFQLAKGPLFRAHDRALASLSIAARLLGELAFDAEALARAAADPTLQKTARALERARRGEAFRDAYRDEATS